MAATNRGGSLQLGVHHVRAERARHVTKSDRAHQLDPDRVLLLPSVRRSDVAVAHGRQRRRGPVEAARNTTQLEVNYNTIRGGLQHNRGELQHNWR